ncbi:MAG TPA: flagellar hook-basal body protein [Tepidisphaeraceae bacterium]|jgi:flagellar basal body rod protein FlgG|nr:flagellar hook-basal body protein [Tepidisphaeraceae bacterium]
MIYGLWLSASGVLTNSYRQDVIANNIANSETVGFKKDLTLLQQRPTAAQELHRWNQTDPHLENIGGGLLAARSAVDASPGDYEPTGNNMDVALDGQGFFAVSGGGQTHLTRNGQFLLNRNGALSLSNDPSQTVLDDKQAPIVLDGTQPINISADGTITQAGKVKARLGLFSAGDPRQLQKDGGTLWQIPDGVNLAPATPTVRTGFIERSNVDPATELTDLMEVQRELEANANMIQIQDQTLDKLVNDVGKVS